MRGVRTYGWLVLLLAGLLGLTSCGTSTLRTESTGVLNVELEGVGSAEVVVLGESSTIFRGMVAGAHRLELAPGAYRVDGMPVAGHLDPTNIEVQVIAGQETRVVLEYQATPQTPDEPENPDDPEDPEEPEEPDGPDDPDDPDTPEEPEQPGAPASVARLEILSLRDDLGSDLPAHEEINANKDVWLYAAQTEEAVCVTVRAADEDDNPVADALVTVQVADAFQDARDRISVVRGCASVGSGDDLRLSAGGLMDSVMTDESGEATFTLYATSGYAGRLGEADVAKIVVASSTDGSSALSEFKIWFANISHLYFNGNATGQRVGASFDRTNLWDSNDRKPGGADNSFNILSTVYQKQPEADVDLRALGYVRYDIVSEQDMNGDAADVVHLENCDPTGGDSCVSYDGSASLVPNADIWLEDLPIRATVRATLVVEVRFGAYTYAFDLKSYEVTKTWIGSHLAIHKQVDHHVLTWYGDNDDADGDGIIEYTLDPANAVPAGSVFTATFSITATNEGMSPVYDVTITDGLPAELGVLEETLEPSGGTYDSVNHAVTWNYQTAGRSEPKFNELAPGESITVSFEVYLRQKPGYCVDFEDLLVSESYMVGFLFGDDDYCYDDPYDVVNGGQLHDVTASWFAGAPADEGGTSAVVDFNGYVYEDDVIIWGVRPVFTLDKRLVNTADLPFEVGMDALFDISIVNEQRIIYDELESLYPDEFDGTARANPYGRSIYLIDGFSEGLDFTSAGPLNVNGVDYNEVFVGDPPPPPPFAPYLIDFSDKLIAWDVAPLMDYRSAASARIVLDNDLPGVHVNIAGFAAGNLNQLDFGDCLENGAPTVAQSFSVLFDCAISTVLEPDDPYIELSAFPALNIEGLDLSRQTVVEKGDEFVYVFAIQNGGSGTADGTTLEVALDNANASLLSATQYVLDPALNLVATVPGSVGSTSASFGPYDHPVGYTAVFVLEAEAEKVGNNSATATADWDADANDTQYPLLPLTVTETLSIKPPSTP